MDRKIALAFVNKHVGSEGGAITESAAVEAVVDAVDAARQGDRENELLLNALDAGGVENWEGYSNALEIFYELLREDEEEDEENDVQG